MDPLQIQTLGKYKLVQHLATGGMAEVYKAIYEVGDGIEKTCVVKRLLPHLSKNPEFVEMFRTEARVSAELSHGNLVQVFQFGQDGESHYLAMEYVRGQDLSAVLKRLRDRGANMPLDIALHIAVEVARALHYAHTRRDQSGRAMGIIHRDVSPDNILLSYQGDVKVTDFGIAKLADSQKTQAGFIKGKVSYIAPEQAVGLDLDRRADIFALGLVLHEMLTGEKVFTGANELEIITKVSKMPIPPPSTRNPHLDYRIDDLVMQSLQRNRDLRYKSAEDFRRAIAETMAAFRVQSDPTKVGEYLRQMFSGELASEIKADEEISKSLARLRYRGIRGFFRKLLGVFSKKKEPERREPIEPPLVGAATGKMNMMAMEAAQDAEENTPTSPPVAAATPAPRPAPTPVPPPAAPMPAAGDPLSTRAYSPSEIELALDRGPEPIREEPGDKTLAGSPVVFDDPLAEAFAQNQAAEPQATRVAPLGPDSLTPDPLTPEPGETRDRVAEAQRIRSSEYTQRLRRRRRVRVVLLGVLAVLFAAYAWFDGWIKF